MHTYSETGEVRDRRKESRNYNVNAQGTTSVRNDSVKDSALGKLVLNNTFIIY